MNLGILRPTGSAAVAAKAAQKLGIKLVPVQDEVPLLRAEIARLRELCIDHGIDPDPREPEPLYFGPPTEWEYTMSCLFARVAQHAADDILKQTALREWLSDKECPEAIKTLRVRLPNDFTITQTST